MAKLSGFKRLNKEDVAEEDRSLIDAIGFSVNNFAQEVLNAFNKRLTIKDNLAQDIVYITLTVGANGVPKAETKFKNILNSQVIGIKVIRAENLTSAGSYINSAPFVTFSQNGNIITINHISGLIAENKYRLTINTIAE